MVNGDGLIDSSLGDEDELRVGRFRDAETVNKKSKKQVKSGSKVRYKSAQVRIGGRQIGLGGDQGTWSGRQGAQLPRCSRSSLRSSLRARKFKAPLRSPLLQKLATTTATCCY